jgi:ketosteroid isomerase-like protein
MIPPASQCCSLLPTATPMEGRHMSEEPSSTGPSPGRSRADSVQLAWGLWEHLGADRLDEGLALLDDGGTWWEMSTRSRHPMAQMKLVLRETFQIVPMSFEHVDAIVEGDRVALMVESHADLPDGGRYNNVYTFITTLDPDRDVIVGIHEYVDTLHASATLIPAVLAVMRERGGDSVLGGLLR